MCAGAGVGHDGAVKQQTANAWEPVVVAFGGKIYGMDPASGARVWSYEADASLQRRVRLGVDRGRVYALMLGVLMCLELATGQLVWRVEPAGYGDTFLVRDGIIVFGVAGEVSAYAAADGRLLWRDEFKGKGLGDVALAFAGAVAQSDATG